MMTRRRRLRLPTPRAVAGVQQLRGAVVVLDHAVEALVALTAAEVGVIHNDMPVDLPTPRPGEPLTIFIVSGGETTYILKGTSEDDARRWIDARVRG